MRRITLTQIYSNHDENNECSAIKFHLFPIAERMENMIADVCRKNHRGVSEIKLDLSSPASSADGVE